MLACSTDVFHALAMPGGVLHRATFGLGDWLFKFSS
jgi:hypothetical protein